jgi:hypothetical protein
LTEFSDLLSGAEYRLTKMRGNITADSMVDVELIPYEEEHYLDSDGDGWSDAEEAIAGTNPNEVDTDRDKKPDPEDPYPLRTSSVFCFIATAAYGSPLDSRVEALREFRDSYLMTNPVGRSLVSAYYELSPPAAQFIVEHPGLKPIVQAALFPAVALSAAAVNTTLVHIVAIAGALALVSLVLVWWLRRRSPSGTHTDT